MAVTLQVKRGLKAALPALSDGEFGWCTDTYELFIGSGAGNKQVATEGSVPAHVMDSSGPHYGTGLTVGYVVRASAVDVFAWAQLQHTDLGGVGANDHHNQIHASTHAVGAADALSVGVPVAIGTANGEGTATNFARRDHVHQHPEGLGVDLHHTRYTDAEAIAAAEGATFTNLDADSFQNIGDVTIDAINVGANSTIYLKNSNATYKANVDVEGTLTVGTNLILDGANKRITFESGDDIQYGSDAWNFNIASTLRVVIDASKLTLSTTDGLSLMGTYRQITFDSNDYLQYASNEYRFYINSAAKLALDASDLDVAVDIDFTGGNHLIKNSTTDMGIQFTDDGADRYLNITNTGTKKAGFKVNGAVVVSPTGVVDGGAF